MSALAKPFFTTADAIGDVDPVNVEQMGSFSVLDVEASNTQNGRDSFRIIFHMNSANNQPKDIIWRYATDVLRDADVVTLNAAITVTL